MKKKHALSERYFLELFFAVFASFFLVASVFMPDRANMFTGLWKIMSSPCKSPTSYFAVGGLAATFLNMGLVGMICLGLFVVFKVKVNNVSTLAFILTTSFGSWGINILNMWPSIFGVILYGVFHREKMSTLVHAMLFSTGLAPLISELLLRYPDPNTVGFSWFGLILALLVGGFVGFSLPVGLANSPKIHKGFTLYSAALPMGMTAFFLNAALFKTIGFDIPEVTDTLSVTAPVICNVFCILLFGSCIVVARLMGCTMKAYWRLLTDDKTIWDFSSYYGKHVFLMNVGVFGLFILAYYNMIGAPFNGVTFGILICMLATCNSGSHPGNVWPIMLGYWLANIMFGTISFLMGGNFTTMLNSQSIIVGLCYANGLSPIADKYGWKQGVIAAFLHFLLVTSVPNLHGGFCLYNGGFTAALVCIFLLPKLEKYCQLKAPSRQRKSEDGHYDGKFAGPNPVHMGPVHEIAHDASVLVHQAGELVHHAGDIMHHAGEVFHQTVEHKHHDEDKDHTKTK